MAAIDEIHGKRRVFVEWYLTCWNATEAARKAEYKHPNVQGPRLLANVGIQAAIKERLAEIAMEADEVLARLSDQASATMADFITIGEDGEPQIDLAKAAAAGKLHLVRKVQHYKDGRIGIELYDSQAALGMIGRAYGMFVDKTALTDPTGKKEYGGGLTDEQRLALLTQLLERAGKDAAGSDTDE